MTAINAYQAPAQCLNDRIILITGAGDGIGAAVAKSCAEHGATVILVGKTVAKLERVYDDIMNTGGPQPAIIPIDLAGASPADYSNIADLIDKEFGRLDGLLHNAAQLGARMPFEQYDHKLWNKVMQVNLNAPFLLTQACLPLLKKSADASVIFTSADVGRHGRAYWGAYAIANAAIENMMQILADELETNTAIRVNSVDPGPVRTAMRRAAFPGEDFETLNTPADIVHGYLYLFGADSKGQNGQQFSLQN